MNGLSGNVGRSARPGRGVLAFSLLISLLPAVAVGAPGDFPRPAALAPQIEFWKRIFSRTSENQVVIHDSLYIDKTYATIDLTALAATGASRDVLWRTRKAREKAEKARIDRILQKLHKYRGSPSALGAGERFVWDLFHDVNEPNKFRAARERVRAQQGLAEKFRRSLEVARRYLPYMEEIFRREGLPVELTRLPLVESSFDLTAYSKVGAAGIWQFIPSSGRIYLTMNEAVDDRRDPLYATAGAARHLRDDYEVLGVWPLAVTAYNHGRAGMAKAMRIVGSSDIATVVRRYKGSAFGFASRNFYAEFVAALEIERDAAQYFPDLHPEPRLEFDEVTVDDYVPFAALSRVTGTAPDVLAALNPAFETAVLDGKLYVPRGHRLRVPPGRGRDFRVAYAKLPATERFAAQRRYFLVHRVARGQTLSTIARRYGTTVSAIQVANKLRSPRLIRIGQVLKIPTG
jgi:membrane-bound lytic murein transglycosylase D